MRLGKGIIAAKICDLCLKSTLINNSVFNQYRGFSINSYSSRSINLLWKKNQFCSLFDRSHSTHVLKKVINEHEETVSKFVTKLMESHNNEEDFLQKFNLLYCSKNFRLLSQLLSSRSDVYENLKTLEELRSGESKDEELAVLAENEKKEYRDQLQSLDFEIILSLLPEEPQDDINDLIIEIKNGVGGQEAMLFAKNLFDMYCHYVIYKGWTYEIAELSASDLGGLRSSSILVYGKDAFKQLCFEGGVHRVQRIPSTEKSGRIHTSTVAIAILPQPSEVQVVINEKDLKIETKRASGAGGQHVNTTDSAVRITHIPTGVVAESQEDRSQLKNRVIAMQRLRATIYERQIKEQSDKIKRKRKLQFGTSGRSEKIRTYNFNQDRITDHRIGLTLHNVDLFLEGSELLDNLLSSLKEESDLERLVDFISNLKVDQLNS